MLRIRSKFLLCALSLALALSLTPVVALADEDSPAPAPIEAAHVEHEAVVCYYPDAPARNGRIAPFGADLLSSAQTLAQVPKEAVEEAVGGDLPSSGESASAGAAAIGLLSNDGLSGGYVIACVRDESKTTEQLIAELSQDERVVFAEPNYLAETATLEDEQTKDPAEEAETEAAEGAEAAEDADDAEAASAPASPPAENTAIAANSTEAPNEAGELAGALRKSLPLDMTGYQWGYKNTGQINGASGFDMGYAEWNSKTYDGGKAPTDPVIAVIDTGIDNTNIDLANKMWSRSKDPAWANLPGGEHGYDYFAPGKDGTGDPDGHGTHCAGAIAAEWNGVGTSGLSERAQLMAVRGPGVVSGYVASFGYVLQAKQLGVNLKATSNSWIMADVSRAMDVVITALGQAGVISIFGSGNTNANLDTLGFMTSTLAHNPYVVVVDAATNRGDFGRFSNYGMRTTDVVAPGQSILSTYSSSSSSIQYLPEFDAARALYTGFESGEENAWTFHEGDSTSGRAPATTTAWSYEGSQAATVNIVDAEQGATLVSDVRDISSVGASVDGDTKAYFTLHALATGGVEGSEADMPVADVYVRNTAGGMSAAAHAGTATVTKDTWTAASFLLPDDTDFKNFQVKIVCHVGAISTLGSFKERPNVTGTAVLDALGVGLMGKDDSQFAYSTGTSMACPTVAGAAAVIAEQNPNLEGEALAATIKGCVADYPAFANRCSSGGMVDLRYLGNLKPVVNGATDNGSTVEVEGYFFGDAPAVAFDGVPTTWSSRKDGPDGKTTLTVAKPAGFAGGQTMVSVAQANGREGHDLFEVGRATDVTYFDNANLPLPQEIEGCADWQLCGFGAYVYCVPRNTVANMDTALYDSIQRFDESTNSWSYVALPEKMSCMSATDWNDKLAVLGYTADSSKLYLYDGSAWKLAASFPENDPASVLVLTTIGTDGKDLYTFGGITASGETAAINRIDLDANSFEHIGDLSDTRHAASVAYSEGTFLVTNGYKLDVYMTVNQLVDRVRIADGVATSEAVPIPTDVTQTGGLAWGTGAVAGGFIATGALNATGSADTYTYNLQANAWSDFDKRASDSPLALVQGTVHRGKFYVLASMNTNPQNYVFASTAVNASPKPVDPSPVGPDALVKTGDPLSGASATLALATLACASAAAIALGARKKESKR